MCDSSRFGRARGIRDHGPAMVRVSHTEYLVAERVIYVCHVERMRKVQTRETVEIHHDRYQQLILPTLARACTYANSGVVAAAILPWSACLDCRRCISANVVSQERNSRAILGIIPLHNAKTCILHGADESNARDRSLCNTLSYLQLTSFLFLPFTGFLNRRDFYRSVSLFTVVGNRQHEPSMIQSFNIRRGTWQDAP
jgi:hypothetical protein